MNTERARKVAILAHDGQLYGSVDYMFHVEQVVELAKQFPESVDLGLDNVAQVAYLHDVLEDSHVSVEFLYACGFPAKIVMAVVALTKQPDYNYREYMDNIICDPLASVVKRADTLANLQASTMAGHKNRIRKYTNQLMILSQAEISNN